jgi:NACalpha-BTF3-like transcription factor
MSKLEQLLIHRTTQIGGKGTPRRKGVRKNQGVSTSGLLNQLDKLLIRNNANPLAGAKSVNFLSESEENKTYHIFSSPQIKYVPSAHLMVIQNATLKEDNEPKTKPEQEETKSEQEDTKPEEEDTKPEEEEIKSEEEETKPKMTRVPNRKERNIKAKILKINPKMKPLTMQKLDPIGYMEQGEFRWNIEEPEVYHYAVNTYIVFGPIKLGMQEQKNITEAEQVAQNTLNLDNFKDFNLGDMEDDADEVPNLVEGQEPTPTPTGLNESDIEVIMEQVGNCTRDQAIKALQNAGGDLVGAVLELT